MMRVAPNDPEKANGFLLSQFLKQVLRQAGRPFTSSIIQLSQNLKGKSWYSNNCLIRRSGAWPCFVLRMVRGYRPSDSRQLVSQGTGHDIGVASTQQ